MINKVFKINRFVNYHYKKNKKKTEFRKKKLKNVMIIDLRSTSFLYTVIMFKECSNKKLKLTLDIPKNLFFFFIGCCFRFLKFLAIPAEYAKLRFELATILFKEELGKQLQFPKLRYFPVIKRVRNNLKKFKNL